VYDRAEIEKIFKKVLQKAEEHGIVYDNQEKVFNLKMAERVAFSLEE
jgi:chorismate mutase